MPRTIELPEPRMFQAHGLVWLEQNHRLIRKLRKAYAPSVHGHKTWHSSFLIMDYLLHDPVRRGASVLDLGCGWAPGGIFCARRFDARVCGIDLDPEVFPFAQVLATLNGVEIDLTQKGYEKLSGRFLGRHELLIGSDICFWDELIKPLEAMTLRALRNGTRRIVIADPGRPTFHKLAERLLGRPRLAEVQLLDWYTTDPEQIEGELLEIRPAQALRKKLRDRVAA